PSRPATTAARPALMARDAVERARRRVPLRGWLATLRVLRRAMLNLLGCEYAGDAVAGGAALLEADIDQLLHELVESDAFLGRGFGQQAGLGHAGQRVHFQHPQLTLGVQHQVHAAVAVAAQRVVRATRVVLGHLGGRARQVRVGDVAGASRLVVLGLEVVEAAWRYHFAHRQRAVADYADGKFAADDAALHHHARPVLEGFGQRAGHVVEAGHFADAKAAALVDRFNDQRPTHGARRAAQTVLGVELLGSLVRRRGHSVGEELLLA